MTPPQLLLKSLYDGHTRHDLVPDVVELTSLSLTFALLLASTLFLLVLLLLRPRAAVYLIDHACFRPLHTCRVPFATFKEHATLCDFFDAKSVQFQIRILERSGLGQETCLPPASHYLPPTRNLPDALDEAELVVFSAIDDLLHRTSLSPKDIDVLVVNCSLFSPVPSLASLIANRYRMRSNLRSFNLSGMGCSAGLVSINLAKDILSASSSNLYAVVVSTEIITSNYYTGNQRSMLLPNCLFRMGAAAVLLSNRRSDRCRAKYRLLHVVRSLLGADDSAYRCVHEEEDAEGHLGITLSRDLMTVASDALKSNITAIGPLVLPLSEQFMYALALAAKKLRRWSSTSSGAVRAYVPDFRRAFEHICIHAGGRAVIDELQKSLRLSAEHVEASRMSLHRFGNTSSSSLWYELSYIEAKGRMKRGDRVWMIGFGSGFKCNSAMWKCIRTIDTPVDGPWSGCIDRYPVDIPDVVKI